MSSSAKPKQTAVHTNEAQFGDEQATWLSSWLDGELAKLEQDFAAFVTAHSSRRAIKATIESQRNK